MRMIKFNIEGNGSSMMHHSSRLANEFNKYSQRLVELNKKKKSKGVDRLEVLAEIAHVEWEGGMYFDSKLGPYIPAEVVRASIINGAKMSRGGASCERAVSVVGAKFPLEYDGPRDLEGLWADEGFVDQRIVTIQRAKVLRTRALFSDWSLEFTISYDENAIAREDLLRYVQDAGLYAGFGDARKLGFGRWYVTHVDDQVVDGDVALAA